MEDLEIVFDPLPPAALREYITDRLAMFNVARTGADNWYPIGFFLRSPRGRMAGRPARRRLGRLAERALPVARRAARAASATARD